MSFPDLIDLHMHSVVSDGTDTPLELLMKVKERGIDLFSLTDHDAIKGCEIILQKIRTSKEPLPLFITGAEFSCRDEEGKYHILGYGYDPNGDSMRAIVAHGHSLRITKLKQRLSFIKERFGFDFDEKDIRWLFELDNPGKPHIANLMVRYGYARDKKEAFDSFLNQKRFRNEYVRPEEAIESILKSGGIPVLAHPAYGDGDQIIVGEELDARIRRLMDFGLQGVEAYYSGFTPRLQSSLLALAEKYDLYVTAGSDYHGTNKMIPLAENNLASAKEGAPGLQRFINKMLESIDQ